MSFVLISLTRYCVCYVHEEMLRLLTVLKKESMVAHENCDCQCEFCADGFCNQVFTDDMDFYWFMRHMLCVPGKLHSQTSRNLFKPRYALRYSHCYLCYLSFHNKLRSCSCLDGNCTSEDNCLFEKQGTIFQCPKGKLFSNNDYVAFEEWVTLDINAQPFDDPLNLHGEGVELHGVPPPKRMKSVWTKRTRTRNQFCQRIFELTPDAFQHHQLEMVQREQLKIHIESITSLNGLIVAWMNYPENANIIDRQEQQSDYYDKYTCFTTSNVMCAICPVKQLYVLQDQSCFLCAYHLLLGSSKFLDE